MSERINNCYYNIEGRCTYPKDYTIWIGSSGRDWNSKENCVFLQDGAQTVCSNYNIEI